MIKRGDRFMEATSGASASPGAEAGGDAAAELRWALEHFHGIGWHGYPDSPCDCPKCQWARRVTALLAPGAETVEQGPGWLSRRLARAVLDGAGDSEPARTFARLILGLPEPASSGKTGEPCRLCDRVPGPGEQVYRCEACGASACTACTENVGARVLCVNCAPAPVSQGPAPSLDRCQACSAGVLDSRLGGMCGDCSTGPAPGSPPVIASQGPEREEPPTWVCACGHPHLRGTDGEDGGCAGPPGIPCNCTRWRAPSPASTPEPAPAAPETERKETDDA